VDLGQQLRFWAAGISMHNIETDTCCPDFSCCVPSNQAPQEEREKFLWACQEEDSATVTDLLRKWLQGATKQCPKRRDRWSLQLSPEGLEPTSDALSLQTKDPE
jgi:hypothetical protein